MSLKTSCFSLVQIPKIPAFVCAVFLAKVWGIDADEWNDFGITPSVKPTSGSFVTVGEITLDENSTLTLTTSNNPTLNQQFFDGDLFFNNVKLLEINVTTQGAMANGWTPIYWRNTTELSALNAFTCGKMQGNEGLCSIILNVNSTQTTLDRLFNLEKGTLTIDQNVTLNLAPQGKVKTIFYNAGTLEFDGRFIADLREQTGTFTDTKINGTRKVVIEHYGANTAVNTYENAFPVQIYGDIISAGQKLELNLLTQDSIFEGHFDIGDSPHNFSYNNVRLRNGASANVDLSFLQATNDAPQRFTLTLESKSIAKIEAIFDRTRYALLDFSVSNSVLYANLSYSQASNQTRGLKDNTRIALNNNGTWISNKSAYADEIYFNVDLPTQARPTALNEEYIIPNTPLGQAGGGGVIDLRYRDFNGTLRSYNQLDENNRIILRSKLISGDKGLFKLYGILNRNQWSKDNEGNSIATDQIITQSLVGNHYIQIYWDTQSLDESLLTQELLGDRIVVARQLSTANQGNFIGATSTLGLYDYTLNLTKENLADGAGTHIGYEWVIGKILQDEAQTPSLSTPSRPSFLSKTLNALYNIPYKTYISQTQTLHQRMGDLRHFDSVAGAYIKTNYSLLYSSQTSEEISAFTHIEDITLGGDFGIFGYGGKHFFGVAFNLTPIQDLGEEGAYSGNSLAYGLSLYHTSLLSSGFYTDTLLKYFFASHQYALYSQDFGGNNLDFSTHSLLGSFELGYRMRLPIKSSGYGFFYLKPQFGLDFGVIFGSGLMRIGHSSGYDVEAKYLMSFPITPSFSVDFGKRFDSESLLGDVFASVGMEYAFNAGNTLELSTPYNSGTFSPQGIFNLKLGVGGNVILMNGTRFYFDISSKFGGRIAPVLSLSAGVRIPIGAKHPRFYPQLETPIIYKARR